jgi:hypothetical protein
MTPEQMDALLGGEWPPPTEHWPPRDKSKWRVGMTLVGRIETRLRLPRPEGSPRRGEPYTALVLRRHPDGRRVTYHGWRTADEDLDGMPLDPGLLFGVVYRGERNKFEDFKFWSTWHDDPLAQPAAREPQTRQAGGRPTEAPPRPAPEAGEPSPSPASGSNQRTEDFEVELPLIANTNQAKAYVKAQSEAWRRDFERQADAAKRDRSLAHLPPLQMWLALITRTWTAQGVVARAHGEAA